MAASVEIYEGAVDKGLEGVVACTTGISSIVDATLCFRGYTIEDIAAKSTFGFLQKPKRSNFAVLV